MFAQRFEDRLAEVLQVLCHHAVVRLGEVEVVVNAVGCCRSRTGEFVQCKVLCKFHGRNWVLGLSTIIFPLFLPKRQKFKLINVKHKLHNEL